MAAGEHRGSSRFRCMTLVRIVAASVFALAFAATVVVVVLSAGLARDSVRLSVTHGHFQSAGPLWSLTEFRIEHLRRPRNDTISFYTPAKELTVWVSMDAHDPTLRAADVCVAAVHVLDMPHAPSLDGMVRIATVSNTVATGNAGKPCKPWRHPGASTMQLDRWITVNDPLMLCYISQKYGGLNDFTVMLKVEMVLYPKDYEDGDTPPAYDTHYCWPVTIGNTQRIRSETLTCKPSQAIDDASINAPDLNPCQHLTPRQRLICNTWGNLTEPDRVQCILP